MNWHNVVRLILLALVVLGVVSFCTLDFGYWESSAEYEPDGLTVTVGRSGGSRTLKLVDRQGALVEVSLLTEWGPDLRTNLYRTEDRKLGIIDFAGAWKVLQAPLRLERTKPSDHWDYVGTFMRDGYAPASQAKECMDILLDEPPPPDRSEMYRRRC
ncbi:hypothetical protein [Devosia sp. MC521]|uniref:hypothetical protein n=1 Tax=Devosia sp. MC521 TaxID=2759954 RepID=UPI0015F7F115|nr:hypothetical protein [Devosia sp. MC521]QMW63511.1 hypothetical protein H4N61_04020 [Devosia sp. MC521]